jgi:hypothetical protein
MENDDGEELTKNTSKLKRLATAITFNFVDFYHTLPQKTPTSKLWYFFQRPTLLFLVGVLSAFVAYAIDVAVVWLHRFRQHILLQYQYGAFYYVCFSVLAGCISASTTYFICPRAAGSGVPEMKTVLSGVVDPENLSMGAFFVKTFGLTAAFAAGLSIGRMGPFVQISCIIADQLMNLPMYFLTTTLFPMDLISVVFSA